MKVLVLGASGMLGHKLLQNLPSRFEVTGTLRGDPREYAGHPVLGSARLIGDVQSHDFDSVTRALAIARPDVVVNAIGLIKQLPGAKDPLPSLTINSLFPHRLAQLTQAAGARLVHISTDCVFSGNKGHYTEDDPTDADDLYGRSKLLGEVSGPGCITLRTSIIGRELKTTSGLVEWFISQRGKTVNGFAGAIYTGFTTIALVELIALLIAKHPEISGVWQASSEPISKYDLLVKIDAALDLGITVRREENFRCDRSLCSERLRKALNYTPPTWDEMIDGLARDRTPYDSIRKA